MSMIEASTVRLDTNATIVHFDCGDTDLNDFLANDAANYQKERLAVTHLALIQTRETPEVAGYFCLLTDKLVFDPSGEDQRKQWKLFNKRSKIHFNKHRKTYPAVKIGRLAVANTYAGQGLGRHMINHIMNIVADMDNIGCRFITVDAYKNAFDFYLKNDFKFLTDDDEQEQTRQMYFDMKQLMLLP